MFILDGGALKGMYLEKMPVATLQLGPWSVVICEPEIA